MLPNMTHWNPHSGSFQFTLEGLPCTTQSLRNRQSLSGSSLSPDSFQMSSLSSLKCECFCGLGEMYSGASSCDHCYFMVTGSQHSGRCNLWCVVPPFLPITISILKTLTWKLLTWGFHPPRHLLSNFATSFWGTWHSMNAILYNAYVLDTLISCMTTYTSFFFTSVCFFMTHSPQAKFLNFSWDLQPYTKLYFVNTPLAFFSLHSCSYGRCSHTSIFIEVYLTSLQRGK